MFTGIVQALGRVTAVEAVEHGIVLRVDPGGWDHRPTPGESIAVNGCCLTMAPDTQEGGGLRFDVIRQTLRCTMLGRLGVGDRVNLEASVTPMSLMGGHVVQGHVDGVGDVTAVVAGSDEHRVRITPPGELLRYVVDKGSVAVDGVSLTVATLDASWFEVALIPTTLELTTFGSMNTGDQVNLEMDYLVKAVARLIKGSDPSSAGEDAARLRGP